MVLVVALLIAALAARRITTNTHLRARLLVSAVVFGLDIVARALMGYGGLADPLASELRLFEPLLLAFGAINAVVGLAVNPWKLDRLPDRFPTIVQDGIVIGLFAMAAAAVLQERILAATAISAVVLGLALQDTLGNLFAGMAVQIEKPFRVGDWVNIRGTDGRVTAITWRATKMRTKAGNLLIVPNSVLSRDTIVNYSLPTLDTRLELELSIGYDAPPNRVKALILDAVRDEALISRAFQPDVLLMDFGPSRLTYRVRFWTTEFGVDDPIKDRVRTAIYYALHREGIEIPYPIHNIVMRAQAQPVVDRSAIDAALRQVPIFAAIPDQGLAQIAARVRRSLYPAGQSIVRQGDPGNSMFVLITGEAAVVLPPDNHEVARIRPGGFFGEMSLLTGAPRNATVKAVGDVDVLEITAAEFREFVLAHPAALEHVSTAVTRRLAELDDHRALQASARAEEPSEGMLDRIRRFLDLAIG